MDNRRVIAMLSIARVGVGTVLLLAPRRMGRNWVGSVADDPRAALVIRGFGARDLALGLGTLRALSRNEPLTGWVQMAAVGDACDAAAGLAGASSVGLVRTIPTVVSAAAAAVLGMRATSSGSGAGTLETARI
jgi:hypothetical protein